MLPTDLTGLPLEVTLFLDMEIYKQIDEGKIAFVIYFQNSVSRFKVALKP